MSQVTAPILLDSTGQDISAKLQAIANAINGGTIDPLTVTQNGTYTPSGTTIGYGPVTVNVGGGGNAWASLDEPSASIGQNGDYYFHLVNGTPALASEAITNASTAAAGWEFGVNESIAVVGARAKARSSYTATIKFGLLDGTVLAEKSIDLENDSWVTVLFDNPITLTVNQDYIIMVLGNQNTFYYSSSRPTLATNKLSYVRGRYGSFPGTVEPQSYYNVDVLIGREEPPYMADRQYYKTGGVWVPV